MPTRQDEDDFAGSLFRLDDLTMLPHKQRIVEARATFWLAYLLLIAGATLIILGAFQSPSQFKTAKMAAGALVSVVGATVLKMHKDAHTALEKFRRDKDAMRMLLRMRSDSERDKAIQAFVPTLSEQKRGIWRRLFG